MARPRYRAGQMKPSRRSLLPILRWILATTLAAAAIYAGGACGNDACENAATHKQSCLMEREDAGGGTETATSTVDCSGATQCDAICVLDSDCEVIKAFYNNAPTGEPLRRCIEKCEQGTTR
jgi:hypothetical protein